jgi:hypothetical protein
VIQAESGFMMLLKVFVDHSEPTNNSLCVCCRDSD